MEKTYQVFIVEDQPADAELIELHVGKANLDIQTHRIQSKSELKKALREQWVDLVISDYDLGDFTGQDVLGMVKNHSKELPFILVSGYLGEKKAVEIMVNGADDYVMKDELNRLGPAVHRELLHYEEFRRQKNLLQRAYSLAEIGHWEFNVLENKLFWSEEVKSIFEVSRDYIPILEDAISFYQEGYHRKKINEVVNQAIEKGQEYEIDAEITTAKGNKKWIRTNGKPEIINGECTYLYGSVQNITDRKQAELKAKETEEKLRNIVEYSTNLFYSHDTNHNLTYVSPQSVHFFACAPEEAMHSWKEFLTDHPVNQKGIELTEKAIESGAVQDSYKLQLQKKDGEIIWVRVHEAPVVKEGETVAIVGSLTDITELEKSLDQVQMLSKVVSETDDMVLITNSNHQIEWVNRSFEKKTGYNLDEIKGKNPVDMLHGPETDAETENHIIERVNNNEPVIAVIRHYTKSGTPFWAEISIVPMKDDDGQVVRFASIERDITERKEILNHLSIEKQRLEEAQRIGTIGDWDYNVKTGEVFWSDQLYEIYDRDPKLGPPSYKEILSYYPKNAEYHDKKVREAIENGKKYSFDIKLQTEKGKNKYVHVEGYPSYNAQGEVDRVHGIVQDITERKKYELDIATKEKQLRTVTDNVDALLFRYLLKPDGTDQMIYTSDTIETIFEVSADEALKSIDIIWDQILDKDFQEVRDSVAKSAEMLNMWDHQFRVQTPSGKRKWLHGRGKPTKLEDGTIQWDTVVMDITDQVQQERKNEALVQEMHHRVKNNLAIITGFLELQLAELEENHRERLPLERAITRIYSIAEVHKLLYEGSNFIDIRVDEYMENLIDHVTDTMKRSDKIQVDLNANGVKMNVNELTPLGMLMNELLTNSMKYAFNGDKNGTILIKISRENDTYQVLYRDNGRGIDQATFEKAQTSGLNIVKILLAQLEADYQVLNEDGFTLSFTFKERKRGAHGNMQI